MKNLLWLAPWLALLTSRAWSLDAVESSKLALYEANGEPYVVIAIAAAQGKTGEVIDRVRKEGGRVDYVRKDVDYLTAVLPTVRIRKFLDHSSIAAAELDNFRGRYGEALFGWESPPWSPPKAPAEAVVDKPATPVRDVRADWPPQLGAPNLEHPYDILKDMDGVAFRKRLGGNDARGVVIAHVEWFPDFLLPELQTAWSASGERIPKFLDVINLPATLPTLDAKSEGMGEFWTSRFSASLTSRSRQITHRGQTYSVPFDGAFRMARLAVLSTDGGVQRIYEIGHKVWSQNAVPATEQETAAGVLISYPVLWSERSQQAWLDTDLDGDFSDELAVGEYRRTHQFGIVGRDDPKTPVRDTVAYALQREGDRLSFNFGVGNHASAVAGAAAANRAPAGRIDGVAPGAQLLAISAHGNDSIATFVRGLITAFTHPQVDVVLIEGNLYLSGVYHLARDGRSVPATIIERLQARHSKPAFVTADNVIGMGNVMDTALAESVIAVGAYQSAENSYVNLGIHSRNADSLHWVGSEGPAGTGALKPDLIAPATPMSLAVGFRWDRDRARRSGVYQLPPGYDICGGTSCATPVAAGAAALLVGAAKRERLAVDGNRVHRAMRESARRLPDIDTYKQGRGLVQVDAAWRHLQAAARETVEIIEVSAPVRTAVSDRLPVPNVGSGLFERDGWKPGMRGTREITLKRKTGPRTPVQYALSWEGAGQHAFETRASVELPLGQAVTLQIQIAVNEPRVYSDLLRLERAGVEIATVPVTIVVPHAFTAENRFEVSEEVSLDRPGRHNLFFDVPEGVELFRFSAGSKRPKISVFLHAPDNYQMVEYGTIETLSASGGLSVFRPMPGVWQVTLVDSADATEHDWSVPANEVLPAAAVTTTASIYSVDLKQQNGQATLSNRYASFVGGLMSAPLAARRETNLQLRAGERVEREIEVIAGASWLMVGTEVTNRDAATVDIHLYDCSGATCLPAKNHDSYARDRQIVVANPSAGRWKVVSVARGRGAASVRLTEAMAHPSYGSLATTDGMIQRRPGDAWSVDLNLWPRQPAPAGFELAAMFRVGVQGVRFPQARAVAAANGSDAVALLMWVPVRDEVVSR
ncbi:S8 family serine peptidase [Peristeroidobacter soli]|uniref:S8 family serine peptidase n=1 Tax=Peristeroidobacter soli TaxID=2497877 RepID=UPI00101D48E2|nr:S8 family serine peptidase [Peristeroidobacter soli]